MEDKIKEIFYKNIKKMLIKYPNENWIEYKEMIKHDKPEMWAINESINEINYLFDDLKKDIEDRIKELELQKVRTEPNYKIFYHMDIEYLQNLLNKLK